MDTKQFLGIHWPTKNNLEKQDMADNANVIDLDEKLSPGTKLWLEEHLKQVKNQIIEEAIKQAKANNSGNLEINPMMISDATKFYVPGGKISNAIETKSEPIFQRLFESISGLTLISAILAIGFGWLGLYSDKQNAASWLDIAKIFAGAVVGSAGAGAVSSTRSK